MSLRGADESVSVDYWISEHVVREMMGERLSVREIEATLRGGRVLEEHYHPQRGASQLKCALVGEKPVHVIHTLAETEAPVIALAYTPVPPLWASPVRRAIRHSAGEESMKACYFCGGELKRVTVGNFDYRLEGVLYVVKKVPALLCLQCGEKYLDAQTGRRLGELIEGRCFTRSEEVKVIDFDHPAA